MGIRCALKYGLRCDRLICLMEYGALAEWHFFGTTKYVDCWLVNRSTDDSRDCPLDRNHGKPLVSTVSLLVE